MEFWIHQNHRNHLNSGIMGTMGILGIWVFCDIRNHRNPGILESYEPLNAGSIRSTGTTGTIELSCVAPIEIK